MTAVIYARYSSDSQRESSIEGQLRDCKDYAEKNGITVVGTYIDRAYSAKTDDRPDFQRMIKDSGKKIFDTIFTIYFTYYFTEAIILEAKFQEKSATTRSFRIVWLLLGALVFIHYIAFMSNISLASILVGAGSGICAIYYCSTMLTACKQLYMEGLPTKHMDISAEKASKK